MMTMPVTMAQAHPATAIVAVLAAGGVLTTMLKRARALQTQPAGAEP